MPRRALPAARTARGWRTPVAGAGQGFPDLVLVRGPELIRAELKAERGRVTPAQREWLEALGRVPGVRAEVWRPAQFDEVHAVLRGGRMMLRTLSRA